MLFDSLTCAAWLWKLVASCCEGFPPYKSNLVTPRRIRRGIVRSETLQTTSDSDRSLRFAPVRLIKSRSRVCVAYPRKPIIMPPGVARFPWIGEAVVCPGQLRSRVRQTPFSMFKQLIVATTSGWFPRRNMFEPLLFKPRPLSSPSTGQGFGLFRESQREIWQVSRAAPPQPIDIWVRVKIQSPKTAGFRPCFHLPG